jgi:hypothetical protein
MSIGDQQKRGSRRAFSDDLAVSRVAGGAAEPDREQQLLARFAQQDALIARQAATIAALEAKIMATRFREHGADDFRFITTPGVAPANNLAEQAIRFVVIDRRITQGARGGRGRHSNERIWTAIATCVQQGRSVFEYLRQSILASFAGTPAPSLLPVGV